MDGSVGVTGMIVIQYCKANSSIHTKTDFSPNHSLTRTYLL
jgi:hypothetical protein